MSIIFLSNPKKTGSSSVFIWENFVPKLTFFILREQKSPLNSVKRIINLPKSAFTWPHSTRFYKKKASQSISNESSLTFFVPFFKEINRWEQNFHIIPYFVFMQPFPLMRSIHGKIKYLQLRTSCCGQLLWENSCLCFSILKTLLNGHESSSKYGIIIPT